jgi:hypothetical protein
MAKKPTRPELTDKQKRTVGALILQAFAVRGVQVFVAGLSVYLAWAEKRGWPPIIIGGLLVAWIETQLPALPLWLDRMRPDDE